jgi:hypothetical protein
MILGNVKLRHDGQEVEMTQDQIKEYIICSQDPLYFTEKYFY